MKIIVRAPNWVGDHVMALPFYQALREKYPQASLTLLSHKNLKDLSFSDIFEDHQFLPSQEKKSLLSLGQEIRLQKYDLSYSLPASYSAHLVFFLAGVSQRYGFSQSGSGILLTHRFPWLGRTSGQHKSDLYFSLLSKKPPFSYFHLEKKEKLTGPIVIAPGASIDLRIWPYYPDLVSKIVERFTEKKIIIIGTKKEQPLARKIISVAKSNRVIDLTGKTTLSEVIDQMRSSAFVICNDSGPAHLSATLAQAKTVVLYGPGDPQYIKPIGDVVSVFNDQLSCRPCEKAQCTHYVTKECLNSITVSQAFDIIKPLLKT